tara:strand:+ start:1129 stop:1692 length:564 start_codon:yes stop_codon:yes gene_type:complete
MLRIFLIIGIFFGIIYGIFKLFLFFTDTLLLIDEGFISLIKNTDDQIILKLIDNNNKNNKSDEDENKKINRHLRLDFIISLFFGFIWFIFPLLIINIPNFTKKKISYLGKNLGLFTLISSLWPLFNIKNENLDKKKDILFGKFACALLTMISFLIIAFFSKTITFGNIISILLTSIWLANGFYGLFY